MKKAFRCVIALGACSLALALGCASDTKMSEAQGDKSVVAVNKTCPVRGEPVAAGVTETYNGAAVGFCCANCESKWNTMTDAQKQEAFKKVTSAAK